MPCIAQTERRPAGYRHDGRARREKLHLFASEQNARLTRGYGDDVQTNAWGHS